MSIERSFSGFADAVLVADVNAKAVGYITCALRGVESQIGLVGIADNYQGENSANSYWKGL